MAVVYHWKHGWIPLDHTAALSKAKGNHEAAAKMLADAPSAKGITSRQHVAKAALDLPNLTRAEDRQAAHHELQGAAQAHNATDLLPRQPHLGSVGAAREVAAKDVKAGDVLQVPKVLGGGGTQRLRVDKTYGEKSNGMVNVDVTDLATGAKRGLSLDGYKKHVVERNRQEARYTADEMDQAVAAVLRRHPDLAGEALNRKARRTAAILRHSNDASRFTGH